MTLSQFYPRVVSVIQPSQLVLLELLDGPQTLTDLLEGLNAQCADLGIGITSLRGKLASLAKIGAASRLSSRPVIWELTEAGFIEAQRQRLRLISHALDFGGEAHAEQLPDTQKDLMKWLHVTKAGEWR